MPSPFAQKIAAHWEANFPKEFRALQQARQLWPTAERAAQSASLAEEQALEKGLSWTQAAELSVELWGTPPSPSAPSLPRRRTRTASETTPPHANE